MKKYTILIEDLTFKAILGLLEKERKEEQLVVVCAQIEYEGKENFVDYAKVTDIIENTIKEGKFKLIEDAADEIEKKLLEKFPHIRELKLKIRKPEILKNALVGVEILRKY
jgi:dihydroneopterin aldolase